MRRFLASLLTVLIVASAGSVAANAAGESVVTEGDILEAGGAIWGTIMPPANKPKPKPDGGSGGGGGGDDGGHSNITIIVDPSAPVIEPTPSSSEVPPPEPSGGSGTESSPQGGGASSGGEPASGGESAGGGPEAQSQPAEEPGTQTEGNQQGKEPLVISKDRVRQAVAEKRDLEIQVRDPEDPELTLYSWHFAYSELNAAGTEDFSVAVNEECPHVEDIQKITGNYEPDYFCLCQNGALPGPATVSVRNGVLSGALKIDADGSGNNILGTKILGLGAGAVNPKVLAEHTGRKWEKGVKLYLYRYVPEKELLDMVADNLFVDDDDMITFRVTEMADYVIADRPLRTVHITPKMWFGAILIEQPEGIGVEIVKNSGILAMIFGLLTLLWLAWLLVLLILIYKRKKEKEIEVLSVSEWKEKGRGDGPRKK